MELWVVELSLSRKDLFSFTGASAHFLESWCLLRQCRHLTIALALPVNVSLYNEKSISPQSSNLDAAAACQYVESYVIHPSPTKHLCALMIVLWYVMKWVTLFGYCVESTATREAKHSSQTEISVTDPLRGVQREQHPCPSSWRFQVSGRSSNISMNSKSSIFLDSLGGIGIPTWLTGWGDIIIGEAARLGNSTAREDVVVEK